jgi:hypothetical protein
LSAKNTDEAIADDARPPTILLRSFDDDEFKFGIREAGPFVPYSSSEPITFEQFVVELFEQASPVLTIGRPGEILPALGAARKYVGDGEWKSQIDQFLADCGQVLMILGPIDQKAGLAWELERIQLSSQLQKVFLLVPPLPEEAARERWSAYADRMGGRLPRYEGGEIAAWFDANGKCDVRRCPVGGREQARPDYQSAIADFLRSRTLSASAAYVPAKKSAPAIWKPLVLLPSLAIAGLIAVEAGLPKAGLLHAWAPVSASDYVLAAALIVICGLSIALLWMLQPFLPKPVQQAGSPGGIQMVQLSYLVITLLALAMLGLTVRLTYRIGLAVAIATGHADGDLIRVSDDKVDSLSTLTLSPNGSYWAVTDYDKRIVHVFDGKAGAFLFSATLPFAQGEKKETVREIHFANDGSQIIIFSSTEVGVFDDKRFWKRRQWNLSSHMETSEALPDTAIADPRIHSDGIHRLANGTTEKSLDLDAKSGDSEWKTIHTFNYEQDRIRQFGFTPDGKYIFIALNAESRAGVTIDLWEMASFRLYGRHTVGVDGSNFALTPSLDLLLYHEPYSLTLRRLPKIEQWSELAKE